MTATPVSTGNARELAANVPANVEAEIVTFRKTASIGSAVYDRYVKYFRVAPQTAADCDIIVSESYGFLLLALPSERTIVVCHDLHAYRGWSRT